MCLEVQALTDKYTVLLKLSVKVSYKPVYYWLQNISSFTWSRKTLLEDLHRALASVHKAVCEPEYLRVSGFVSDFNPGKVAIMLPGPALNNKQTQQLWGRPAAKTTSWQQRDDDANGDPI